MFPYKTLTATVLTVFAGHAVADGGSSYLTQNGTGNHAEVKQNAAAAEIRQTQTGDYSKADADQANEVDSLIVQRQTASGSDASTQNVASSVQGWGSGNTANLQQIGTSHEATTWQEEPTLSKAFISQTD